MSKFPTEFTQDELTEWLNSLDIEMSYALIEKLYKDMRDFTFALQAARRAQEPEVQ